MDNDNNDDERVSEIKDGFADVFSQFQSMGDISQVSIDFEWNTYIVPQWFIDLIEWKYEVQLVLKKGPIKNNPIK